MNNLPQTKEIIFSASSEFGQLALNEIQKIDPRSTLLEWLENGIGLVLLDAENFLSLSQKIVETKTVFIRHLFPVMEKITLENSEADFSEIQRAINIHLKHLAKTISIQIRLLQSFAYSRSDLYHFLSDSLIKSGFQIEVKQPVQIISILCTSDVAYLGISEAEQNLSSWSGGMHRFAQETGQISRAEFKLLEAIAVFNLTLPTTGTALDLGASPGGWTRILRQKGFSIVAVDPGDLAESLQSDTQITHHRQLVQQFLPTCNDHFDLIVNDMRMDAIESAKLMRSASDLLKENGLAIMTLKLSSKRVQTVVRNAIATLEKKYDILGVRNLFHNRQEATVAMRLRK
jgi:23S rRNA (cytidine2498-2'-O)-methyltransferase